MVLGKTSSAMYPFLEQLLKYDKQTLGMLILDVKGNFFNQVLDYADRYNRNEDIIIISLDNRGNYGQNYIIC